MSRYVLPLVAAIVGVGLVTLFWWRLGSRLEIPAWVFAILSGALVGAVIAAAAKDWGWGLRLIIALAASAVAFIGEMSQFTAYIEKINDARQEAHDQLELNQAVAQWQLRNPAPKEAERENEEPPEVGQLGPPVVGPWEGQPDQPAAERAPASVHNWLFAVRLYLAALRNHLFGLFLSLALAMYGAFQAATIILPGSKTKQGP
ncbi:hypothetical protein [Planctomycetes bacterium Pan216]